MTLIEMLVFLGFAMGILAGAAVFVQVGGLAGIGIGILIASAMPLALLILGLALHLADAAKARRQQRQFDQVLAASFGPQPSTKDQ